MKAKHRIVAYRLEGVKGGINITALTESPRGTRIAAGQVKALITGKTKEETLLLLQQAFEELQVA